MKALLSTVFCTLLAGALCTGPAAAQAVDVVVASAVQAEAAPAEEPAAEPAPGALQDEAEPGELPIVTITANMQPLDVPPPPQPEYWDGLYTPGELAVIRMHDLAQAPWEYGVDLKYMSSNQQQHKGNWVDEWGLAGVDLVPFFTGDAGYAARKTGIVLGVDKITDAAGDWVADETGLEFFSAESQDKLEKKFGWLSPILSFF
jgi:hypothetical protein